MKYLGFKDLYELCKSLSRSQGFYGRMLENLNCCDEIDQANISKEMEKLQLRTDLDIILWLEQ